MAQWLRALHAFPEGQGSILSTHNRKLITTWTPGDEIGVSPGSCRYLKTHMKWSTKAWKDGSKLNVTGSAGVKATVIIKELRTIEEKPGPPYCVFEVQGFLFLSFNCTEAWRLWIYTFGQSVQELWKTKGVQALSNMDLHHETVMSLWERCPEAYIVAALGIACEGCDYWQWFSTSQDLESPSFWVYTWGIIWIRLIKERRPTLNVVVPFHGLRSWTALEIQKKKKKAKH